SSPSGSRSTSTSRGSSSARRSTTSDELQARGLRAGRGARRRARRALRGGGRPDRRVRAVLVVHAPPRHAPRGRRREPRDRRAGGGGARPRAPARDGRPGRPRRGRRRRAPARSPVRGAGVRPVPAPVKARLFTDGGARGNPGPAAFAYVLEADDGTV